jgi:predicted kinase
MRKWMRDKLRRKKAQAAPESTGRIGQPKDPTAAAPLQPAYDTSEPQPPAQREPERRTYEPPLPQRESQPERLQPPREPQRPQRHGQRFQRQRQRPRPPRPPRPEGERPPRDAERVPAVQMETQPESPTQPPAAPSEATGQAPGGQKARAPRGVVVLAIGLPGSGKTTWFKRRGVTPLSSDLLRNILFDNITEQRYQGLVFSTLRSLLRARLIARMPWNYVDATNLSPRERRQWIRMARSLGYEVHAVFFDVPLEVCLERNRKRERVVPEDIMQRMASKLKPPTFEEGFSKVIVVRVKSAS